MIAEYSISKRGMKLFSIIFMFVMCAALGNVRDVHAAKQPTISNAVWNAKTHILTIQGRYWGKKQPVVVSNANSGSLISSLNSTKAGSWSLKVKNPTSVPCAVRAESGIKFSERAVKNAAVACSQDPFTNVFAFNDLGMHCMDKDYSVFSILPPFNVLHAQVVRKGVAGSLPQILDNTQASVFYSAVADNTGSINTTSVSKTNFWTYVQPLFGVSLPPDTGFLGFKMPGASNTPQLFSDYDPASKWFAAIGIPLTPIDDNRNVNTYPLMRIQPFDSASSSTLPPTFAVAPVSDEMHCSTCHSTGGVAANSATMAKYGISAWSASSDAEIQYRENILILHGKVIGVDLMARKPVLCSSCHYMLPLDLAGVGPQGDQVGKPRLSIAIHGRHGKTLSNQLPTSGNPAVIPDAGLSTCYNCHPGTQTKCLRGAMADAGIICQQCHGGLLAISGQYKARTPWVDLPKCQSCHTGDSVSHLGSSIIGTTAYDPADPSATPIIATNQRFAENSGKLYRFSFGHSGIACEACHGSTHAEWPVGSTVNDNIAAIQLQGHTGPIIECTTCHADGPPLSLDGPHGMHNVNDSGWNRNHDGFFERNRQECQACHGLNLEGTILSRAAADRSLSTENGTKSVTRGTQISCTLCHENPLLGGN